MKKKVYALPLLGIALFYAILRIFYIHTNCYIKGLFGIPCPGCGLTRAYGFLLKGDFYRAFFYHPLFWLPPAILVLLILQKFQILHKSKKIWIFILILVLAVYIIRMALYFPHTAPMQYYPQALFPKLISQLIAFLNACPLPFLF